MAVIEQMRLIVQAHTIVLDSVKAIIKGQQYNNDIILYSKEDVWSQVQTVVRIQFFYNEIFNAWLINETFVGCRSSCC